MSQKNLLSASISAADKEEVLASFSGIKAKLDNLLHCNLSNEERRAMLKLGDRTMAFVDKAFEYAANNPELVPAFLNLEDARKDYELSKDIALLLREIGTLQRGLENALMVAGSEAYHAALIFHSSVKSATRSGISGSRTIYADLVQRFPGRPSTARAQSAG
jgi:hypothetical protein